MAVRLKNKSGSEEKRERASSMEMTPDARKASHTTLHHLSLGLRSAMMYMSCKGGGSKWFLLIKSSEGSSSTMFVLGMMPSSLGEKEKGKKTKIKTQSNM